MTNEESQILTSCKEGDKTAFRWVVTTYQQRLFSVALKMLADEEDAKDVVQETFIRVWQEFDRYDLRRSFSTWIYTITTRICVNKLNRKRFTFASQKDVVSFKKSVDDFDGQRVLENKEWILIIRLLTEDLSPKQRLVFSLSQIEGLTSAEVEQITGMSASQVKSNLYLARQTIRKRLKDLGYE